MYHRDARIEKPEVEKEGINVGKSDPVLLYDEYGRYHIALWNEHDNMWHEMMDGYEETFNKGIVWWAYIQNPDGWMYDSDFYS